MILPFAQTGTLLDAVPVPGAILTRSLRATYPDSTEDQSFLHPSPYWIKYSIYFINYSDSLACKYTIFGVDE